MVVTNAAGSHKHDLPAAFEQAWADISTTVRTYGAVGNGTTDDTTALQAAIDTAASGGRAVIVPPGVYLTGPLKLPAGVVMTGLNGQAFTPTLGIPNPATRSCLKLKPGSTGPLLSPLDTSSCSVRIRDIALDCGGQQQPAVSLPDSPSIFISRDWIMERVFVGNVGGTAGYGVYVGQQNGAVTIRDSFVFNATRGGSHGVGWYGPDGLMENTYIGQFGGPGLIVLGGNADIVFTMRGGGSFGNQAGAVIAGGGVVLDGVSIDRNYNDGLYVVNGPLVITNSVFGSNSRQTDNWWSNVTIDADGVQVAMSACRVAPLSPEAGGKRAKYMIDKRGHTGITLSEFGNVAVPGTLGTGWTS